jgi:hypothetical protein
MNLLKLRLILYLWSFKPPSSGAGDRKYAGILDKLELLIWLPLDGVT